MTYPKFSTLAATACLISVAACTDIYTPTDSSQTRTGEGAAIGAATGAVFGALVGGKNNKGQSAAVGAVVGGLAGGLIGYDLDRQAAELRSQFANGRIEIIKEGNKLVVRMPQDILFAIDSANVQPALRSDLRVLANSLNRYAGSTVVVFGHTDNTGSAAHNLDLSKGRAQSVANILVSNGVVAERVRSRGKGEEQPIASNLTPEGRAQNRRVEIIIRPQK